MHENLQSCCYVIFYVNPFASRFKTVHKHYNLSNLDLNIYYSLLILINYNEISFFDEIFTQQKSNIIKGILL